MYSRKEIDINIGLWLEIIQFFTTSLCCNKVDIIYDKNLGVKVFIAKHICYLQMVFQLLLFDEWG